jgi:hypothetical protein
MLRKELEGNKGIREGVQSTSESTARLVGLRATTKGLPDVKPPELTNEANKLRGSALWWANFLGDEEKANLGLADQGMLAHVLRELVSDHRRLDARCIDLTNRNRSLRAACNEYERQLKYATGRVT